MNRGEMRDLARKRLGETTAVFWSDTELDNWINYAGHDVAYKTKCIQNSGTITTVEDTSEYNLTTHFSSIIDVTDVYFYQEGTSWTKLNKVDRKELDLTQEGWMNFDSSTPQDYIFEFSRGKILTLSPPPNADNAGTGYLKVYYADDFTDITSNTAEPDGINQMLQLAMVDLTVAYGYETRGYITKAREVHNQYNSKIQGYLAMRDKEMEQDSDMVMKGYRNI